MKFLDKLRKGEPFKFSRWGDGEWLCMQGEEGENRDGNTYLPELGKELMRILQSEPNYYIGIQYGVFYNEKYVHGHSHPSLREFMIDHLFHLDLDLVNGDILHQASEFGYLKEFTDALKDRNVVIIGAAYFKDLPYHHIVTREANSFHINRDIIRETEAMDVTGYNIDPVYLVASAMNSNVIIDRLPDNVTAIDIGSVFDPYLGRPRASYQHNVTLKDLW